MHGYVNKGGVLRIKTLYTAFEDKFPTDYVFGGEYHNFWELVFVLDGELGAAAGGEVFVLHKGQAILHEPMEFHSHWSEGGTGPHIMIFSFGAENMPPLSSRIFEVDDVSVCREVLEGIHTDFEMSDINVKGIKKGISYQLSLKALEMLVLKTVSQKLGKTSVIKSRTAQNFSAIMTMLENNIEKNLSVAQIAKMCNMSEVNLKKTFSRYAGVGVMSYFNYLKITAAISMLQSGMSVQETATKLGFANQNYFSTVFRRITGNAPTYYK